MVLVLRIAGLVRSGQMDAPGVSGPQRDYTLPVPDVKRRTC